jgi:hypothetical protein
MSAYPVCFDAIKFDEIFMFDAFDIGYLIGKCFYRLYVV